MEDEDRVFATITICRPGMWEGCNLRFYVCSGFQWEQMTPSEQAEEVIDRLRTAGINIDVEAEAE